MGILNSVLVCSHAKCSSKIDHENRFESSQQTVPEQVARETKREADHYQNPCYVRLVYPTRCMHRNMHKQGTFWLFLFAIILFSFANKLFCLSFYFPLLRPLHNTKRVRNRGRCMMLPWYRNWATPRKDGVTPDPTRMVNGGNVATARNQDM